MGTHRVCLSFDFDAISVWLGPFNQRGPTARSRGEFGAVVAVPRILDLLAREGVKATFFVPGHTLDTFPNVSARIVESGHEIGHHGYLHENPAGLPEAEERRVLEAGIAAIERVTGKPPRGYRSPGWELTEASIDLFLEYGFEYDSSMMGRDFALYRPRTGDVLHDDRAVEFGRDVDLVEVPVSWSMDDFPQFEFIFSPPVMYPAPGHPPELAERWIDDFDYMVEQVPDGVFSITFHPQVIGRGARMRILERLIAHMKHTPGVDFTRVCDAVDEWRKGHPLSKAQPSPAG
jgi:peptidoglycan-N-acetylglucosamine deacetylase